MRSIRLSLTLYFLALLGVALGAASFVVYRTARETLEAKKVTTEELIQAQHRERCREKESRLDDTLSLEAQALAGQVRLERGQTAPWALHRATVAGMFTAGQAPCGYVLLP